MEKHITISSQLIYSALKRKVVCIGQLKRFEVSVKPVAALQSLRLFSLVVIGHKPFQLFDSVAVHPVDELDE